MFLTWLYKNMYINKIYIVFLMLLTDVYWSDRELVGEAL